MRQQVIIHQLPRDEPWSADYFDGQIGKQLIVTDDYSVPHAGKLLDVKVTRNGKEAVFTLDVDEAALSGPVRSIEERMAAVRPSPDVRVRRNTGKRYTGQHRYTQ